MIVQPCDSWIAIDNRDTLKYSEHQCDLGVLCELRATENLCFGVRKDVLIWYHHTDRWHKGKVVSGGPSCYQVEFQYTGGPRIRSWYTVSLGFIRDDTPKTRETLKAHGIVLDPKP